MPRRAEGKIKRKLRDEQFLSFPRSSINRSTQPKGIDLSLRLGGDSFLAGEGTDDPGVCGIGPAGCPTPSWERSTGGSGPPKPSPRPVPAVPTLPPIPAPAPPPLLPLPLSAPRPHFRLPPPAPSSLPVRGVRVSALLPPPSVSAPLGRPGQPRAPLAQ